MNLTQFNLAELARSFCTIVKSVNGTNNDIKIIAEIMNNITYFNENNYFNKNSHNDDISDGVA